MKTLNDKFKKWIKTQRCIICECIFDVTKKNCDSLECDKCHAKTQMIGITYQAAIQGVEYSEIYN